MVSRSLSVRFASIGSFDKGDEEADAAPTINRPRRLSTNTALEASLKGSFMKRLSIASSASDMDIGENPVAVNVRRPSLLDAQRQSTAMNTAIAANDGPSLAAALTQSIRHHAKLIDGEQQPINPGVVAKPAYDPYEDDDHVSLAPGVELNYEKDPPKTEEQERSNLAPMLRDFMANAGVEDINNSGPKKTNDATLEQHRERIEKMKDGLSDRLTSWFKWDSSEKEESRPVRFAANDGTAILDGGALPGPSFGIVGRAPKFIAPPPTSFRSATRHPSHLPVGEEFDDMESRLNAPRRILAARKRHRRNDSFLRLMVAVLCFALSLTFAIIYGEGKFGLAITTMAYERKVSGRYDLGDPDSELGEAPPPEDLFYPDWWESEKGIPDMEKKGIKFAPTLEYNAADVVTPRAPDRIETPFFWFIPRSGGNVIRTIMAKCLRLAEASEHGAGMESHFLRIEVDDDRKFVNVDLSTSKGIKHANALSLAASGVPDVIISPDIQGVLNIFNNRNRARIFAVLRHPLDRAISKYKADLGSDPEVAGMTLPQYVRSGGLRVENNYLTRYLSGRYGGKLRVHDLDLARELLRRKFVVGLANDLPATANLFSHVFGWNHTAATLGVENVDICYNAIFDALSDKAPLSVEEGSDGWKLLVAQNWFDLKLYEYAEHLFQLQVDQLKKTSSMA
ncbi:hypothetical protein ACHAXR_010792 [Thalassiosira sp. AJA248-18]